MGRLALSAVPPGGFRFRVATSFFSQASGGFAFREAAGPCLFAVLRRDSLFALHTFFSRASGGIASARAAWPWAAGRLGPKGRER